MVDAVVYCSKCGHAWNYAKTLAEKLNVPVLKISHAKRKLKKGANIVFIGWVREDKIVGYDKMSRFHIDAVCAVGIMRKSDEVLARLIEKNVLYAKLFYLRGGIQKSKLSIRQKIALKSIENNLSFKLLDSGLSKEEASALDAIMHNLNYASPEELNEVLAYYGVEVQEEHFVS